MQIQNHSTTDMVLCIDAKPKHYRCDNIQIKSLSTIAIALRADEQT